MDREHKLTVWAADQLESAGYSTDGDFHLVPASNDASFRRYFRSAVPLEDLSDTDAERRNFVFMDAPPELEDSVPFVTVNGLLMDAGVQVPEIYATDLSQGFMMLTDFGDELLLGHLLHASSTHRSDLYAMAMESLLQIQSAQTSQLPVYTAKKLQDEMDLFESWFLEKLLGYQMNSSRRALLDYVCTTLIASALEQPTVFVHRDYHARNLMLVPQDKYLGSLGVIDFQDAVEGPVSYDLVSLLRDCYFKLPGTEMDQLVSDFHRDLTMANSDCDALSLTQFRYWFDLMGLQRHLKCAGIFARLFLRDDKPGYLNDIPLVLQYLLDVASCHDMFVEFSDWLRSDVIPAFDSFLLRYNHEGKDGAVP